MGHSHRTRSLVAGTGTRELEVSSNWYQVLVPGTGYLAVGTSKLILGTSLRDQVAGNWYLVPGSSCSWRGHACGRAFKSQSNRSRIAVKSPKDSIPIAKSSSFKASLQLSTRLLGQLRVKSIEKSIQKQQGAKAYVKHNT